MNPDTQAWNGLRARAAAQLSPGFADRVLRAAHARTEASSLLRPFAFSVAMAALCLLAVILYDSRTPRAAAVDNLADWQQIASASEALAQAQ